jgi:hypothetical protein
MSYEIALQPAGAHIFSVNFWQQNEDILKQREGVDPPSQGYGAIRPATADEEVEARVYLAS